MGSPSIHSCLQTPSIAGATSTYAAGPCESGVAGNPRPVARLDASPPPPSRPGERFQLPPPQAGGPFGSPGQWPVWVMVPPLALPPPRPVARLVDGSTVVGCHHPRPVASFTAESVSLIHAWSSGAVEASVLGAGVPATSIPLANLPGLRPAWRGVWSATPTLLDRCTMVTHAPPVTNLS